MRNILVLTAMIAIGCSERPEPESRAVRHDTVLRVSEPDRERLLEIANAHELDAEARRALDDLRRTSARLERHRHDFPVASDESRAARREARAAYRTAVRRSLEKLPAGARDELARSDLRQTQLARVLEHERR
jgi:hypothetical protein